MGGISELEVTSGEAPWEGINTPEGKPHTGPATLETIRAMITESAGVSSYGVKLASKEKKGARKPEEP